MERRIRALGLPVSMVALWAGTAAAETPEAAYPELDLSFHLGAVYPTKGDESLADAGIHLALEPVFRLGRYGGVGVSVQHSQLDWRARGAAEGSVPFIHYFPDDDGSISLTQVSLVGRWYILGATVISPYLQAGLGYGNYVQLPEHPQCSVNDAIVPSLSGGADYGLLRTLRVGLSLNAFTFGISQSCTEQYIEGAPPAPPWPGLGVALRAGMTTVWGAPD